MISVYLAGEIHTNWRDIIIENSKKENLDIDFYIPQLSHSLSDKIGSDILGDQGSSFYNDNASSKINNIRTQIAIKKSDIVIVKFGEQYKQWNAAFDAGYANALNKKIIVIHPQSLIHPLKEIDAIANASVQTEEQAIEILKYIIK